MAEVICVEVHGSAYGIPVAEVQEVISFQTPTRVFHAPPALAGITSLRGEVLAVVDLASLLEPDVDDARKPARSHDPRVVVVRESSGSRRRAGLKVDALLGLRQVPEGGRSDVPASVAARLGSLVSGIVSAEPAFALLSVSGILDAPELRELSGEGV